MQPIVHLPRIERNILMIRRHNVMLDRDLADLYNVPTKALIQAVKRNRNRFPNDFMFQLTEPESVWMRSQNVTGSKRNIRFRPYAFTEQGVAMLSSVLHSKRAVQVNIAIMRAFIKLRELLLTHSGLAQKLRQIDHTLQKQRHQLKAHAKQIKSVFAVIALLIDKPLRQKKIGFKP